MTKTIWVTSDHHFSQESMLNFKNPDGTQLRSGFSSVEEMDEVMIERWNSRVKKGDHVWHLGDLYYDHKKFVDKILPRLNGQLRITVGNHDNIRELAALRRFEHVVLERHWPGALLCHVPRDKLSLWDYRNECFKVNIHGHIHGQIHPDREHYINVCVEQTDYYPVNLREILEKHNKS